MREAEQDRVGLADAALEGGAEDAGQHQRGDQAGASGRRGGRRPSRSPARRARCRGPRRAVDPDRRRCALAAEFDGGGLQPVDADRLLVARLVLEADVDVVAALDHLLGGLDEAGFVAIDRRKLDDAGQRDEERNEQEERGSAAVAALCRPRLVAPGPGRTSGRIERRPSFPCRSATGYGRRSTDPWPGRR